MDSLLKEISSTRVAAPDVVADGGLTIREIKSRPTRPAVSEVAIRESTVRPGAPPDRPASTTPDNDLLSRLRSQINADDLLATLRAVDSDATLSPIHAPPSSSTVVIRTLLEHTLLHYWPLLSPPAPDSDKTLLQIRKLLLAFFGTVPGISSAVARLKILINAPDAGVGGGVSVSEAVRQVIELLQAVLEERGVIRSLWSQVNKDTGLKARMMWGEVVGMLAGGKVLSVAAEGRRKLSGDVEKEEELWITDGKRYCKWIGEEIAYGCLAERDNEDALKALGQLLGKALGLGYSDELVMSLINSQLFGPFPGEFKVSNPVQCLKSLLSHLQAFEKRNFLLSLLRVLSKTHLLNSAFDPNSDFRASWWKEDAPVVGACTKLLLDITRENIGAESFQTVLLEWLISDGGTGDSINVRRAVLLVFSKRIDLLKQILEKTLTAFGDKLWTKLTPMLRQESTTQTLLLAIGLLYRHNPTYIKSKTQSGAYLGAITNRLGANSVRARVLGIWVGEAVSNLVDKDKKLRFDMEEFNGDEGQWWKSIISVDDKIADDFGILAPKVGPSEQPRPTAIPTKRAKKDPVPPPPEPTKPAQKSLISIIDDEDEEEDPELQIYAAPSDDEPDPDEDPTTVNRNKPSPPVYLRDLASYLRNTESYDHTILALEHAAPLILRKATFGTELNDALPDLIPSLLCLHDAFDIPNFEDLRHSALVALIRAAPTAAAPIFIRNFFEGDLNVTQRLVLLSALTLGARALAGLPHPDIPTTPAAPFPSKLLPARLHSIYAVDALQQGLTQAFLAPLASNAAADLAGPKVLQVTRTSRRLELQRTRRFTPKETSPLAKTAAQSFIFPLLGWWWRYSRSPGAGRLEVILLGTYVKTVFLVLHAAGPGMASLGEVTRECIEFLSGFRAGAGMFGAEAGAGGEEDGALDVLQAVVFGYSVLLELHLELHDGGNEFIRSYGRDVNEGVEWVQSVFGRLGSEGEEGEVRRLCAGVIVRWGEMLEGSEVLVRGWGVGME